MFPNKIPHYELAFDIDGVIADTFGTFIKILQMEYNISIRYEDLTEYHFWRTREDLDEQTSLQIIERILDDPLGAGIKPIHGAVPVLRRLLDLGPLLLVTARPDKEGILKWLKLHFHLAEKDTMHLIATGKHKEKLPILLEHNVKYFVEDRLETCYLLEEAAILPIVFEQPWNQKPHLFHTVRDWDEMAGLIQWV